MQKSTSKHKKRYCCDPVPFSDSFSSVDRWLLCRFGRKYWPNSAPPIHSASLRRKWDQGPAASSISIIKPCPTTSLAEVIKEILSTLTFGSNVAVILPGLPLSLWSSTTSRSSASLHIGRQFGSRSLHIWILAELLSSTGLCILDGLAGNALENSWVEGWCVQLTDLATINFLNPVEAVSRSGRFSSVAIEEPSDCILGMVFHHVHSNLFVQWSGLCRQALLFVLLLCFCESCRAFSCRMTCPCIPLILIPPVGHLLLDKRLICVVWAWGGRTTPPTLPLTWFQHPPYPIVVWGPTALWGPTLLWGPTRPWPSSTRPWLSSTRPWLSSTRPWLCSLCSTRPLTEFHSPLTEFDSPLTEFDSSLIEFHSPLTEFDSPLTEFDSSLTEFHSSLTEFHSSLTEFHSPLTEFHSPLTEFDSPLTEFDSPLTEFHSSLTEFHSSLTEFHSSLTKSHPSLTESLTESHSSLTESFSSLTEPHSSLSGSHCSFSESHSMAGHRMIVYWSVLQVCCNF